MRRLVVSLVLLVVGNSAWAGNTNMSVTEVSPGAEHLTDGVCTLSIKSFGHGFTYELWIKPATENGISKNIQLYVPSGPYPTSLPPELQKTRGYHAQVDVSYAGRTLTLRDVAIQWNGKQYDPKYFHYTTLIETEITNGIDIGKVTRVKYTFTSETGDEEDYTESVVCTVKR